MTTTTLDLGHHRWVAENTQNLSREELEAAHKALLAELVKLTGQAPARTGPSTKASHLGDLVAALRNHHQDAHVMVECWGRRSFAGPCGSYRDFSEEVAISPDGRHPTRVGELVANLRTLLRTGVTGHEGGYYVVREQTPVWVAPAGEASHQRVTGVLLDGDTVVVTTAPDV